MPPRIPCLPRHLAPPPPLHAQLCALLPAPSRRVRCALPAAPRWAPRPWAPLDWRGRPCAHPFLREAAATVLPQYSPRTQPRARRPWRLSSARTGPRAGRGSRSAPSVRARPGAARNHGSRRLGAQPRSAPRQPPPCQGGEGGAGRGRAPVQPSPPRWLRGSLPVGVRRAVPSRVGARGRRAGLRGGRAQAGSSRGGVPAGARTRSCGARRGVGAANPQLSPPAQPDSARPGWGPPGRGGARTHPPAVGTAASLVFWARSQP